jgi:ribonuclease VapC
MTLFVDASAIVAIAMEEIGFEPLALRLSVAGTTSTSPIAFYEAVTAIARIRAIDIEIAKISLADSLNSLGITIVPMPNDIGGAAIDAHARFGKGRHPAALNMGDCFAYACAKRLGVPLLYKGNDFALTDVQSAMEATP